MSKIVDNTVNDSIDQVLFLGLLDLGANIEQNTVTIKTPSNPYCSGLIISIISVIILH